MRTAIVLFNLGGPDSLQSVRPFLQNLFSDPAIIGAPTLIRLPLAWWIAKRRTPKAQGIYAEMGGKSPINEQTDQQARALEAQLGEEYKVFYTMRYWHPMSDEVALAVTHYNPDRIILLPLYPQFSTTTTGSSFADWQRAATKAGLEAPTQYLCCYPQHPRFIQAHAELLRDAIAQSRAQNQQMPRILFSAHGLPEKIIAAGDPYQQQVEATTQAVVSALVDALNIPELDFSICYQSRVGPLKWIGPSTEDEITRAGADKKPIILTPIAFVSEHSETLVELDIEYRELAEHAGVLDYIRVPALSSHPLYIQAMAEMIKTYEGGATLCRADGKTPCQNAAQCPHTTRNAA